MNNEDKKNSNSFLKYSSMAFQMLVTIGLFCFAGYKLDAYQKTEKPIYMALLGLAGVAVSLYQVVRQLNKK
jgi:F0F1-type ATP synthase assembly protein I